VSDDQPNPWADYPLHVFRFEATFAQATQAARSEPVNVASAAFSEITGLEATMEPKVIKEGGRNFGVVQRVGPTTFATVVFKRGVTTSGDMWSVFETVAGGSYNSRLDVTITMKATDGSDLYRWKLYRAMPTKFKTADFNAQSTTIGIEELHLAHEGMMRR
jgi:phage tail-like protein